MSSIVKVDTIQENTSANGITVDGLNIKDSKLVTSNSVVAANITADAVDATKIADNAISEEHLDVTSITGHTAETSIADGDTLLIHDASASALRKMTKANFVSGIGATNTPNFRAFRSSAQSFSASTNTTVVFNGTSFDSASGFNTSTGKFTVPSGQGGKYYLTTSLRLNNSSVNNEVAIYFIVGSTEKSFSNKTVGGAYPTAIHSDIVSLSAGDEVFVRIYTNVSSPILDGGGNATYTTFEGFKLAE